jgi:hypothetical protein
MSSHPRSTSNACLKGGHVPTSVVLEKLLRDAPPDDVTIAWLIGSLSKRSFGLVMLLIALVGLVPGVRVFIGILLAFPAFQMMLGQESPSLPRFIARRRIPTPKIARLVHRTIPLLKRLETIIHPRWHPPFEATKRVVGLIILLLAATLIWPFPFSHIVPALVIMLVSFAYLEEDGVCSAFLWRRLSPPSRSPLRQFGGRSERRVYWRSCCGSCRLPPQTKVRNVSSFDSPIHGLSPKISDRR